MNEHIGHETAATPPCVAARGTPHTIEGSGDTSPERIASGIVAIIPFAQHGPADCAALRRQCQQRPGRSTSADL